MIKRLFPILFFVVIFALGACAEPRKYSSRKLPPCASPNVSLQGVPYPKTDPNTCAVAISPFDISVWVEAPYNSHKVRSLQTVDLGCKPLSALTDECQYCGPPGHSNTLMMNFDPSVYPEDLTVRRAVLAVYSPNNPAGLHDAYLRGRLSVGDELQSLARKREGVSCPDDAKAIDGWIFFDVTNFVARSINERRNSIHFEMSVPCQTPATNLVTVGVNWNEPHLLVEYY